MRIPVTQQPKVGINAASLEPAINLLIIVNKSTLRVDLTADCFPNEDLDGGALDLHRLIAKQCELRRLPKDNIHHDQVDTARDRAKWFSRRGGDNFGHNTILVL